MEDDEMLYGVDDVISKLDEVVSKLDDIERELGQIRQNPASGYNTASGAWSIVFVIPAVIMLAAIVFSPTHTNTTLNKIWYSQTKDVAYGNVTVEQQPTDCDWGHAPLGNKGCHYKKVVTKTFGLLSHDTKTGKPIISYDEGKTWDWYEGTPVPKSSVSVSWQKVEGND